MKSVMIKNKIGLLLFLFASTVMACNKKDQVTQPAQVKYYRIKEVAKNGNVIYSKVIKVNIPPK